MDTPIYVISVISELLGLHPQTLRQYERIGLITPSRSIGNVRLYSDVDLERLKFITYLTKELGVNLAGVEIIMQMKEEISNLELELKSTKELINSRYGEELIPKDRNLNFNKTITKVKIIKE